MKLRMALATGALGLAVATLSGCGSSDPAETPSPATPTSETSTTAPTPSPSASTPGDEAAALVGDWEIPAEDYVLHLKDDGSFVQDYQGLKDFRTGTYTVEGKTISLVGGDGDTDEGTITGDTLVFQLGTATRVK